MKINRKLQIKHICESYDVKNDKLQMISHDIHNISLNATSETPIHTKEIKLTETFINDDLVLKQIIKLLKDNNDSSYQNRDDLFEYELFDISELKDEKKLRKFLSKMISNGTNISMTSRFGPGDKIIFPIMFKDFDIGDYFSYFTCYYTDLLTYDIIIFRKKEELGNIEPKIVYIKNDKYYNVDFVGEYEKLYGIVKIVSKKRDRIDKLNSILEE